MPDGSNFQNPDLTEDDKARQARDAAYQEQWKKDPSSMPDDAVAPNPRLYQWGGQYGQADRDVARFQQAQKDILTRQAVQTNDQNWNADRGNANWSRDQQNQAASAMLARAQGRVPSIAQMQADRQMQQASAEQASAAASARGPAALALAQQNAAGNTANLQSSISSSAQINAANERLQAEQAAVGAYGNMRQGDMASQQLSQQNAGFNAQLEMQNRAQVDAQQNAFIADELGVRTNQLTAQQNYEAALQAGHFGQASQTQQQQQIDHQESQDAWNTAVGIGSTVLGAAAYLSDERTKNVGSWADPEALDARAGQVSVSDPYGTMHASDPVSPPDWLNSYMAQDARPLDPNTPPQTGVAGAPKGLAAARSGQPGGMFGPSGSATPDGSRGVAPGTSDYDQAFSGSNQRAAAGKSMTDDQEFAKAFSSGKSAADKAMSADSAADAAKKPDAGPSASGLASRISKESDKLKQHSQTIQFSPMYTPPKYITSDTRAKEEAVFQRGRVHGMMEADKEAGRPFVVDSTKPPTDGVVDTRPPAQQRAAEAGANVFRTTVRHPLERAQPEPGIVERAADGVQGSMEAPLRDAYSGVSGTAASTEAQGGAMGGLASRVKGAAREITSDERAKRPVSDEEADRLRGEASKMAASPYYTPSEKKSSRVSDADAAKMKAFADGMAATMKATRDEAPVLKEAEPGTPENGYNTRLVEGAKAGYEKWKQRAAPGDSGEDYDYRGAYAAGLDRNGYETHLPDTFKKPNHETFSDESKYAHFAPAMAGSWDDDRYQPTDERRLRDRAGGLARAARAQDEAGRKAGPTVKPSDWYAANGDQAPLARANRSMASQPYTYKKEFTPPDQKPGELNVGPMAQNMAADPVARTAIKKADNGLLVIDQAKLDRLHSAGISHLQERDDDKEERMRRLESMFGG